MNEIEKLFEAYQKDLTLDDLQVHWAGQVVRLLSGNTLMAHFTPHNVIYKIKNWCVKNSYRCSQIQNGRILL